MKSRYTRMTKRMTGLRSVISQPHNNPNGMLNPTETAAIQIVTPQALQQAGEHARFEQDVSALHSRTSSQAKCREWRSAAE